jgi:DNA-binding IclR family transcriptional regulator
LTNKINELEKVDEIDLKYLTEIESNPGIRQYVLAERMGEYDSKVHYRLLVLERLGLVALKRGRRSLECHIGPQYSNYLESRSEASIGGA